MLKFDITKFAKSFEEILEANTNLIEVRLPEYQENKKDLDKNHNSLNALGKLVMLIKTNGLYYKEGDFEKKWQTFINNNGADFRTNTAKQAIINLVGKRHQKSTENLLEYLNNHTIKEFTNHLLKYARNNNTIALGPKSRDIYLRDFTYWDRVPIDIHEKRFIIRTGIFHSCTPPDKNDPIEYANLQNALVEFCRKFLTKEACGIKLSESPGIVDIFIWSYCAEGVKNSKAKCGKKPQCSKCTLKESCLYGLTRPNVLS